MRRVISRAILASDGKTYPEGTPVSDLPAEHHESLEAMPWTRLVPDSIEDEKAIDAPPEPAAEVESEPESEDEAVETPDDSSDSEAEATSVESDTPLEDIGDLSVEHRDLLASAGVATLGEAKAYLAKNKTFRTVSGIGKVGDREIREALGL